MYDMTYRHAACSQSLDVCAMFIFRIQTLLKVVQGRCRPSASLCRACSPYAKWRAKVAESSNLL